MSHSLKNTLFGAHCVPRIVLDAVSMKYLPQIHKSGGKIDDLP